MFKKVLLLSLACILLTGCKKKSSVPYFSKLKSGKIISKFIPARLFAKETSRVINTLSASTLETISKQKTKSDWNLSGVDLGLSLSSTVGVGPVSVGTNPVFILYFRKK
ncbi:MAG: hypothetical protein KAG61_07595 [Bacteriovoracaceae bacterium]|nr:hypothetical protein [Bacteriovoracaceae bacterium]